MAKILFIKPVVSKDYFMTVFPLGLMYLASVLRKNGHDVKIIDMRLDRLEPQDIIERFKDFKPDFIGFSTLTPEAKTMHQVAALIKREDAGCKIIVGGPHTSSYSQETLWDKNIDFLVIGEGEQTLPELINAIECNQYLNNVKGIAYCRDGNLVFTKPHPAIEDLDTIPFPAWDLVEVEKYFQHDPYYYFKNKAYRPCMPIFTSRGCPYKCIYCHSTFGRYYRARSPENVLSEIETIIKNYNIKDFEITIIDDCFNLDLKRAKKICDLIINKNLNIKISLANGIRGDIMDEELLHKLKKANVYLMDYAIETASPRLQKLTKRNLNLEKIKEMISKTSKLGICTHGLFMLGFPTETREDMLMTIRFASQTELTTANFFVVNPFQGTELFQIAQRVGKNTANDFDNYSYTDTNFNLSEVEDEEFFALKRKAYKTFYLNFKRILQIFKFYHNKVALLNYFRYFIIFLNRAFNKKRGKF